MQKKIYIVFVILVLMGITITGILSLGLLKGNYAQGVEERLIANAKLIKNFMESNDNFYDLNLDEIAKKYSQSTQARITFIDKDGVVRGDSDVDLETLENHKNRPEIKKAIRGDLGISKRHSESIGLDMFYIAVPVEIDNEIVAVTRVSLPLDYVNTVNKTLFKYILASVLAGMAVALLLGYRYVKGVTEPIKALTEATKNISQGNYGERVYFNTDDELGILANNFNIMSEKLSDTINQLEDRNTKNKAILTSMINGIIAIDNNKKIMFINPAAESIFRISEEDVRGKHILEVVRNNYLDEEIQKLFSGQIPSKVEIEIFDPIYKTLAIYTNPIKLENDPTRKIGVVIIIQDITEIRKLERMRKDFVANVSHELKTPLTSIKGFIETLKDGASEDKMLRDKFLNIIDIEAGRLTAIIEDLLVLSDIENKHNIVKKENINVNKAIEEVLNMINELSKKKEIQIINKVNANLPDIVGNLGWFKQMLINLIDNAIKYTPLGGQVIITAYAVSGNLIIKIKDTGIGIDKQHLSRLFERFYRVDKARSRKIGGTGLGLAIVKHIVLAFNGKINVKSEIDMGTEFMVSLPIKY